MLLEQIEASALKRVCHITIVHPNRYDDRIFEKECVSLAKAGYEVFLIVNDELPDETVEGVNILSLRSKVHNRIDRSIRLSKLAYDKALELDAEIYHVHDPELLNIAYKLQKNGKKAIFDSHEFTAEQIRTKNYIPKLLRGIISDVYRSYERHILRRLSGLIVPCLYEGRDYFEDVDIRRVVIDNYPVLSKYGLDFCKVNERDKSVCYIGTITESRGAIEMVKAAYRAHIKLVLIGKMPSSLLEKLESMPEFENVEYLGEMEHEKAIKIASKSRAGLSLLHNEGQYSKIDNLPVKLYEYMMLGLPAVVSDFPYYKKVLSKYEFGIAVDPMNVDDIADAIKTIVDNIDLQNSMSQAGQDAIANEMNWNIEADKLVELYESI